MRPKHVELKKLQINYIVASSWHFTLFHDEDAWSDNPQIRSKTLPFIARVGVSNLQVKLAEEITYPVKNLSLFLSIH